MIFPCPKPPVREKKKRLPIPRGSWVKRSTKPIPKVNRKRKQTEFARTYHSKARVKFVQSLPCIARPGCQGAIENAHVINDGSKGAGRKSGYGCIAPLCHRHHRELHESSTHLFQFYHNVDLRTAANRTQLDWQKESA